MNSDMVTVLLVDDHAIVRQGLKLMLEERTGLCVVDEAENADSGLQKALLLRPNLILMDLLMPDSDSIETIRQLRKQLPETRILVLSSSTEDQLIKEALSAGAHGYMLKASRPNDLLNAIDQVNLGFKALDPIASDTLIRQMQQMDVLTTLTPRERDVFDTLAQGRSNAEIAAQFMVSEGTVRTHVANVLDKLQLRDRTQVTIYALKRGLIRVEDLP